MSKEEMGTKIENAFHSIGVEEGFRRGFQRANIEFDHFTFECIEPHLLIGAAKTIVNRLSDGWWLTDRIICPPFVILIFCREKERKEQ